MSADSNDRSGPAEVVQKAVERLDRISRDLAAEAARAGAERRLRRRDLLLAVSADLDDAVNDLMGLPE